MGDADRRIIRRDTVLAGLATLIVIGVVLWSWADLWTDAPVGRMLIVAACGALPAIAIVVDRGLWPRVGLAVAWAASLVIVIGTATDVSITALLRLQRSAWSSVRALIEEGFSTAASVTIPLAGTENRPITALLLIVIATTTSALVALVFVARRPVAGVVGLVIAVAYRWTLVPPEAPLRDGLIVVVAILAVLSLIRIGPVRRARNPVRLVASGGVVLALAALIASAGWGQGAWWDWRNWSWGTRSGETLTVSSSQSYGPLRYEGDPVVVARVTTDRPTALRQNTLGRFDGTSFTERLRRSDVEVVDGAFRAGRTAPAGGTPVTETVEMTGLRSEWILTSGVVRSVAGIGTRRVETLDDGTFRVSPILPRGSTYRFEAVLPEPGVATLMQARRYSAGEVDDDDLTLDVGPGHDSVTAPVFGTSDTALDPGRFGPYADVYRRSREIIGNAASPYVAVNRLERHLRDPALYTYDTDVERPDDGTPDLAYFLLQSHRGYCQQFAGSLALMLRMNGIPARVAVGLNVSGSGYDVSSGTYLVTDRDVHAWVEVKLPGQDWLPFDPTSGRSAPNSASVSDSDYAPPATDPDPTTDIAEAPVAPDDSAPAPDVEADPGPEPAATPDDGRGAGPWIWGAVGGALLVVGGLAAVPVVKRVRRRRRRRGDPRARVLGAAEEIEGLMADLGAPPDPSATADERISAARRDLGIDAARIYRLARQARFAPGTPTDQDAADAWREVDRVRGGLPWGTRVMADMRTRSLRRPRSRS